MIKVIDTIREIVCVDCKLIKTQKGCSLCLRNKQIIRLRNLFFKILNQDRTNTVHKIENMADFKKVIEELNKQPDDRKAFFLQQVFLQILTS